MIEIFVIPLAVVIGLGAAGLICYIIDAVDDFRERDKSL